MEKVLVLMGGPSTEHDVSLRSGAAVVRNLPAAGYEPVPVVIGPDGRWRFPPAGDLGAEVPWVGLGDAVRRMEEERAACAFIAMHGLWGEDGRIQSLFDLMGVPQIGADAVASAVSMDKWLSKAIYRQHGIPTPDAVLLSADEARRADAAAGIVARFGLPCVVKTPRMGSSRGVWIPKDGAALGRALADGAGLAPAVMVEAFRRGRELTVPVLEDAVTGEPRALPVIEIVLRTVSSEFFDYDAKYDEAATDEVCPARIPDDVALAVQEIGVAAHRALMLSGFSRTDVMWDGEGFWTLETNTIPGLTEASLFPKAVAATGGTFAGLVATLVRCATRGR